MRRILGSLVCVIVIGLLPAAQANAGWVIEQVVRSRPGAPVGGGDQDRQVLTMSADRIKTTTLDRTGEPTSAWITDLAAQTLTSVDYDRRTVATGPCGNSPSRCRAPCRPWGARWPRPWNRCRRP